ncbi:putative tungsten-containing aldehyde ferredoxin oxidoreductase cofactor-modifying protein [Acetobacterium woodii DSM 1030]|uniref:Putative tungsten-containing aldehyde ferredoxin oxidoreductase cofactor-modifying protein n=1 Tax=Acetobacterium woodii (strain ATCC 29683 / DSM 1030 / JCM 2381 / KCTC 1655 / WB1) TaxID=931626 RepID=H6LDR8_ACEWD|nr:putative tungsten-containing aldehyde ferredoxin oxidoreductase cofactor-modifying protein [Acetobacterium woodii DSM 1030]
MVLRAKTLELFKSNNMNEIQNKNSKLNISEINDDKEVLNSYPRRLVFELTNLCNLSCVMCGRNDAEFEPTVFDLDWMEKFNSVLKHVEEVTLMGWGEPTVHPKFIKILEKMDKYNVRKYFCTNGMKLDEIKSALFDYNVDLIAVSLDGADAESNSKIRVGSDFDKIINSLKEIVKEKKERNTDKPYINFVFTAMKSNLHQIPDMVRLTKKIGLQELKVVYMTIFNERMLHESLYNSELDISRIFTQATELADKLDISIKLPHIQGEDIAENNYHKKCFVAWRDFFLGSDGYVRPCMSTPMKLFNINDYDDFDKMWNSKEYVDFRKRVNNNNLMDNSCKNCYQSSFANWNNKESFIQIGKEFSPEWKNE